MNYRRPDHEYREADVLSATPERLVVLFYERLVQDLEAARSAQKDGDAITAVDCVHHSQLILTELAQALDPRKDAELAANLGSLYEYLIHEHRAFLADRGVQHLDDCLTVIEPLLESWRQAAAGVTETTDRPEKEHARTLFSVSA
jgi:flagellar protein FliS